MKQIKKILLSILIPLLSVPVLMLLRAKVDFDKYDNNLTSVTKGGITIQSLYIKEFDEYEIYEIKDKKRYCGRYSTIETCRMLAMFTVFGKVI